MGEFAFETFRTLSMSIELTHNWLWINTCQPQSY
jgi:hypothetical protein